MGIKKILRFADDVFLIAGIGFISVGCFLIYVPLGYIIIGLGLVTIAILLAKRRGGE